MSEEDTRISEIIAAERSRLRAFIRRRVPDASDVERWDQMTPEERETFCQGLHGRWGREAPEQKPSV